MRVIEGHTLIFRPIAKEDTDFILRWRNSDHVKQNFVYQKPITRKDHERWLNEKVFTKEVIQFIMIIKETDCPIGSVYLRDINREDSSAEYGIFIGEQDALGCGFGSEAIRVMIDYAFSELGLKHLRLRVLEHNLSAIHIYEKVGFVRDMSRNDETFVNGNKVKVFFYQMDAMEE